MLDQHKCCRERAKLEFLVTQKFFKKKRGVECRWPVAAVGGLLSRHRQARPVGGRFGFFLLFIYIYIILFYFLFYFKFFFFF